MLPICRKNHSEKSFNDLVIKDALKVCQHLLLFPQPQSYSKMAKS